MLAGEVLTLLLVVGPEKSLGWWRNVRSPLTTAGSAIQPPALNTFGEQGVPL